MVQYDYLANNEVIDLNNTVEVNYNNEVNIYITLVAVLLFITCNSTLLAHYMNKWMRNIMPVPNQIVPPIIFGIMLYIVLNSVSSTK